MRFLNIYFTREALFIKNCNLINMAGIYKEKKDLVVKDGKVLDICDDACQKYGQGNVIKKRDDTHKMAQANKAFAHYAW